tara:strand:- start:4024 stop:4314 length:291 start_codon:yes stop_codon:yes gene_type:complete
MNAGIGASGTHDGMGLAGKASQGVLQDTLHGPLIGLILPPMESGSIIVDGKQNTDRVEDFHTIILNGMSRWLSCIPDWLKGTVTISISALKGELEL